MESQVSSHSSTEPTTCPYPEPAETIPRNTRYFFQTHFIASVYAQVVTFLQAFFPMSLDL